MSPLGDQPRPIDSAVAAIEIKLAAARDLREGLAGLLQLPIDANNDQIFAAVRAEITASSDTHDRVGLPKYTYLPPGVKIHAQIQALEEQYARLDRAHDRLIRSLRAKGVLE